MRPFLLCHNTHVVRIASIRFKLNLAGTVKTQKKNTPKMMSIRKELIRSNYRFYNCVYKTQKNTQKLWYIRAVRYTIFRNIVLFLNAKKHTSTFSSFFINIFGFDVITSYKLVCRGTLQETALRSHCVTLTLRAVIFIL